jgi:anaerobic selenocysteine-containing dehydrogenase
VAGCGLDFVYDATKAEAYETSSDYQVTFTTCPYCSASCGQRVVVDKRAGSPTLDQVIDIYGDFESPMNSGGLCSKGAGALQLVNNPRRIGAWETATHPTGHNAFVAKPAATAFPAPPAGWTGPAYLAGDYTYGDGVAYWRLANDEWTAVPLPAAMADIAGRMKSARDVGGAPSAANSYNKKNVAFFGSSHMNNESNYIYRKLIANFGTSNVEHQARI